MLELARLGLPRITHEAVQTADVVSEGGLVGVLLDMREIIVVSRESGYHFEGLACDAIVDFIERYLAEHRQILRREDCRLALVEILDVFVHAGGREREI